MGVVPLGDQEGAVSLCGQKQRGGRGSHVFHEFSCPGSFRYVVGFISLNSASTTSLLSFFTYTPMGFCVSLDEKVNGDGKVWKEDIELIRQQVESISQLSFPFSQ